MRHCVPHLLQNTYQPAHIVIMAAKLQGLSEEQVRKAVVALLKFVGQKKDDENSLFDEDEFLYLVRGWGPCRRCMRPAGTPAGPLGLHASGVWAPAARMWGARGRGRPQRAAAAHPCSRRHRLRCPPCPQVIALKKIPQQPRKDKPIRL